MNCLFATDLHGSVDRYTKLYRAVRLERPAAVFIGGDLLPHGLARWNDSHSGGGDFLSEFLIPETRKLKDEMGEAYPVISLILGNDDPRIAEDDVVAEESSGLWNYVNERMVQLGNYSIYGYAYVPPTPFQLKDWDRYDVSRFVGNGCVSPEEGQRTVAVEPREIKWKTIQKDLESLTSDKDLSRSVFLFHAPPYKSGLDRAALDGQMIDHAPLDIHVGSIAIKRFIETRQPYLTMHGHIHESARLTGKWKEQFGRTTAMSAAHDGEELALIRFDLDDLSSASRELL